MNILQVHYQPAPVGQPEIRHPRVHVDREHRAVPGVLPPRLLQTVSVLVQPVITQPHWTPDQPGETRHMFAVANSRRSLFSNSECDVNHPWQSQLYLVQFQFVQKRDSNYAECKEETVWSMERFNEYVNEFYANKNGVEQDWVFKTLTVISQYTVA